MILGRESCATPIDELPLLCLFYPPAFTASGYSCQFGGESYAAGYSLVIRPTYWLQALDRFINVERDLLTVDFVVGKYYIGVIDHCMS